MNTELGFTLIGLIAFGLIIFANLYQAEVDKQLIKKECAKHDRQIIGVSPMWVRHFFFRSRAYQVTYKDLKNQVRQGECVVQWRTVYWQDSNPHL